MILEKEDAVARWRDLIGPTDAGKAKITHPQRFVHVSCLSHTMFFYELLKLKNSRHGRFRSLPILN